MAIMTGNESLISGEKYLSCGHVIMCDNCEEISLHSLADSPIDTAMASVMD